MDGQIIEINAEVFMEVPPPQFLQKAFELLFINRRTISHHNINTIFCGHPSDYCYSFILVLLPINFNRCSLNTPFMSRDCGGCDHHFICIYYTEVIIFCSLKLFYHFRYLNAYSLFLIFIKNFGDFNLLFPDQMFLIGP